jgi:cytochrome P450
MSDQNDVQVSQRPDTVKVEPGAPSVEELKARYGRDIFNDFDYKDPKFGDHITEVMDLHVNHCPVAHSKVGKGYWWVSRNADIRRLGQDWKTFSSAQGYIPNRPEGMPYILPVEMDPPRQTIWRTALNPGLAPEVVASFAPRVRADANVLIDRFIDRGECEYIAEFGSILPGWALFKYVLGVPVDQLEQLVYNTERSLYGPTETRAGHAQRLFEMLDDYLKQRSKEPPRGDMVDTILKGVTYENGEPAPWQDQLGIAADLVYGGIGTTIYVLGSVLHYLATHPVERQLLIDKPELVTNAVEEFVRVFPPVIGLARHCTRDVEVSGTPMKKGDCVVLAYSASSRDPRVVENPTEIDITRQSVLHSAFGVGPHRCIGSNLARLEMRVAIEEWLRRIPQFRMKPGTEPSYETDLLRSMVSLHLVW